MKYNNHLNYKKRRSFLIKLRIFMLLLFVLIIGAGVLFYFKYVKEENVNTPDKTTSQETISVIAPSINIFKSPFFQFQAPDTWVEIPGESTSSKFVYRGLRTSLIEHELIIYVNQIPVNLESNRIYSVSFRSDNTELAPIAESEHCVKALNNVSSMDSREVTINNVRMRCDSDSTNFTVMAGLEKDDTTLNMIRPDGTPATYAIYYTNLRAVPDVGDLKQILETFQTR